MEKAGNFYNCADVTFRHSESLILVTRRRLPLGPPIVPKQYKKLESDALEWQGRDLTSTF